MTDNRPPTDAVRHDDILCAILTAGMFARYTYGDGTNPMAPADVVKIYRENRRMMFPRTAPL
jgi:hypothetical protein